VKCGIYIRSGRALQTGKRVASQLDECRARASELGFAPSDILVFDEGQQGGDTWWVGGGPRGTGTRTELAKLADAIKADDVDTVVVQSRDRVSDTQAIWDAFETLAEEHGVRLVAIADEEAAASARSKPVPAATATPEARPPRRAPRQKPQRDRWSSATPESTAPREGIGLFARLQQLTSGPPPPPPHRPAPLPSGEEARRPCAIYVRSARSRQAAVTIPAQIEQCTEAALRLGFTREQIAVYDEGVIGGDTWWTGTGHKGSRRALGALVEAAQAGHTRALIVATAPVISHMEPILAAFRTEVVEPHQIELILCDKRPDLVQPAKAEVEPTEEQPAAPVRSAQQQWVRGVVLVAAGLALMVTLGVFARGVARHGRGQYRALVAAQKNERERRIVLEQAIHPGGGTKGSALGAYLAFADAFGQDLDAAIVEARKRVQAAPTESAPKVCLAMLHNAKGETDEAEALLKAAAGLDPTNAEPLLILADLHARSGDAAGAQEYLRSAVRAAPQDGRGYTALAESFTRAGDLAKAASILRDGVARNPNEPLLRNSYALALLRKGDRAAVTAQISTLQTRHSASGVAQLLEAEVKLADNKPKEALDALQQSVKINSELGQAYRLMGGIYAKDGRYAEAAGAYQRSIIAGCYDPTAFNELAYIMATANAKPAAAVKLAQMAVAMEPTNPHLRDTLAWACYAKGDYKRALEITTALMKTPNPSPTYRFHYGMSLLRNGDKRGYVEIRAAAEADPKADWIDRARDALNGKLDPVSSKSGKAKQ
jgi:tetratricopeptide (TPR) repeat protein/DNA invertase Pin-like site-specific DNA recombinase